MEEGTLAKKLGIKPNHRVLLLNAPEGYRGQWKLPDTIQVAEDADGAFDVVHLFAADTATLNRFAAVALGAVASDGRLWVSFPKGSSKIQTDLTRDNGWDILTTAGRKFMSLISVNEVWSAARLKPSELTLMSDQTPVA